MQNLKTARRFPGLNGLRFLAAIGVLFQHSELFKSVLGLPNAMHFPGFMELGYRCVDFFFVLSGFLITFLLLQERDRFNSISIKNFYARRILRIWPLYFIIVILSFLILPHISIFQLPNELLVGSGNVFWRQLGLYLLFCPHLANILIPPSVYYAGLLWSVGVEEWFYAVWPWLVRWANRPVPVLIAIIVFMNLLRGVLSHIGLSDSPILSILSLTRFDVMSIGALMAVLLRSEWSWSLKILHRIEVQAPLYLATFASMLLSGFHAEKLIQPTLFGLLILNVATNPRPLVSFESAPLSHLGDISYGIYCYSQIGISIAGRLSHNSVLLDGLAALVTIGIAEVSYQYVERSFLRLKQQFSPLHEEPAPPAQLELASNRI